MHRPRFVLAPNLTLDEILAYHQDVLASLRLYFSLANPAFTVRFKSQAAAAVRSELAQRLDESDSRSTLAVLTSLEAVFRVDFNTRCRRRLRDDLSFYFRQIEKTLGHRPRLDEDILEGWARHTSVSRSDISQLRSALKLRHWLAHGRYWAPKLGRKYDFNSVYVIASAILAGFPFEM